MIGYVDILPKGLNLTFDEENQIEKDLVQFLGHRKRNRFTFSLLITLYSFLFATGFTGNLCTCITIWKSRDMHTPTNFYLFSLAISDLLLVSFGLSVEMYNIYESWPWIFGEKFCIIRTVVLEIVTCASILTVFCFTVERYLAICFPIVSQKVLGSLNRAVKMIIIVWFLSFLLAIPYTFTSGSFISVQSTIRNMTVEILDSRICAIRRQYWESMLYYMAVTTFLVFVIPIIVITVLYILMGITLYKASRRSINYGKQTGQILLNYHESPTVHLRHKTSATVKTKQMRHSRRAVLKMLVVVVIAFFICWAPFHTQRLTTCIIRLLEQTNHSFASDFSTKFQEILFFVSGILCYLSATINPIVYNIMSKRYRKSFKRILCHCTSLSSDRSDRGRRLNLQNIDRISQYRRNVLNKNPPRISFDNRYRYHLFSVSVSNYKLVIGSRRMLRANSRQSRLSFHYRLSYVSNDEREKVKLEIEKRNSSSDHFNFSKQHRQRFLLHKNLSPPTPPNTSNTDSRNATQLYQHSSCKQI